MPILLFKLNGVPDDEADEIRALLDANHVDYYETDAGRWSISLAAIWLRDDNGQEEQARQLIDEYQERRAAVARERHAEELRSGTAETLLQRLQRRPLQLLFYAAAVLLILYLTLSPFIRWH